MKTGITAIGAVLIIVALILGGLQLLHIYNTYEPLITNGTSTARSESSDSLESYWQHGD